MKHPIWKTAELLAWMIASLAIGFLFIPKALANKELLDLNVNPWILIGVLVVSIGLGTVFWFWAFKHWKREYIPWVFALGMGAMISRLGSVLFPETNTFIGRSIGIIGAALIFYYTTHTMQKSWTWVKALYWIQNLFMVAAIPTFGAIVGILLPWWAAVLMLVLASAYDAIAVWKTKHMVDLAMGFIDLRVIPGLSVPYKNEKKGFALLGGGDIFFITLIAASIYKVNVYMALCAMIAMAASIVVLFGISKKNKFYPALPFILAGLAVGSGMGWIIEIATRIIFV